MSLFTIHPTTVVYETVSVNSLDVLVPSKLETLIELPKNRKAALVLTRDKDRYAIKFVAPKDLQGLGVYWEATENRYLYGITQAIEEYKKAVQELPGHLENLSNLFK
jgi:hypothetical protein